MSKYIDAEAFREEMDNDFPFDKWTQDHEPLLDLAKSRIIRLLAKFPSADVEPVRYGHWEQDGHHIRCSECKVYFCDTDREGDNLPNNYCPNCGARMDEKEQKHERNNII